MIPQPKRSGLNPSRPLLALILCGLCLHAGTASAVIEEIVVTATKREESVRDIPVSIDALSGDSLVQQGTTNLDGILKNSPGVNISGGKISIRGMGLSSQQSLGTAEETGRFLGEAQLNAPSTAGGLADFDPYDMATVEILKGPQSTLFGGTALSGAIRYVPNKPDVDGFAASLRTGYGRMTNADEPLTDASAMVNVPVGDSFALRATGTVRYKPNTTDDLYGARKDTDYQDLDQVRYMARWEPTENFSFDLTYLDYAFEREFTFLDNTQRRETNTKRMQEPENVFLKVGSLSAQYEFETVTLVGIANSLENGKNWLLDSSPVLGASQVLGAVPITVATRTEVPSYELRMLSNDPSESDWSLLDNWDYLVGLYYMTADQKANQVVRYNVVDLIENDFKVNVSEKALFLNLTRHLYEDKLDLNLGARFAQTELRSDSLITFLGVIPKRYQRQDDGKRINPSLALTWHFSDEVNIRGSYAEGFRFGGANGVTLGTAENLPLTFDSDSVRNFEVGLRSDWFDQTLRVDLTAFHILWDNLQLTQISRLGDAYVDNVGAATINGLEAQVTWQIPADWPLVPAGLTLNTGISFLDARTSEYFESANGEAEKGTRLPLSPRQSAVFGLSWQGVWSELDVTSSVQAAYAGDRKNELIETYRLDGYTTYNASFRIANPNWPGTPAISLSGTNLSDELVLYNATPTLTDSDSFVFGVQSQPRTIKLSLEFAFH